MVITPANIQKITENTENPIYLCGKYGKLRKIRKIMENTENYGKYEKLRIIWKTPLLTINHFQSLLSPIG